MGLLELLSVDKCPRVPDTHIIYVYVYYIYIYVCAIYIHIPKSLSVQGLGSVLRLGGQVRAAFVQVATLGYPISAQHLNLFSDTQTLNPKP